MTTSSKSISSRQLAQRYGISQTSMWFFMQKVRKSMENSKKCPLSDLVHVDEFTVGGKEDGKQGRSYDSKKEKSDYRCRAYN